MRTTWRATCLGLMLLGPLLTACGGDDGGDGRAASEAGSASTTSSAAPTTGVYGQPADPDAGEPDEVATDSPAAPTPSASSASGAVVAPRLTYYGWNADIGAFEAGGIVPGIVESGGTCTLTLTMGPTRADTSSEGVDNVTSTSCSEMVIGGDRLAPGTWQAVVSYESATARGVSEPVEVQVP